MNFKTKAYLQKLFSILPNGEKINYAFQKYVTRSLPIPDSEFLTKLDSVNLHFNNYKKYSLINNTKVSTYYEFGSGYDMVIPITMSLYGFKKLICIDIRELIFPELINDSISRLRKFQDRLDLDSAMIEEIPAINRKNYKDVLRMYLRTEYIAPLDARKTGIESNSVDFILSNATMEHIPKNDLPGIMKECHRILKPDAIMSNVIDYRDHWSFFDNSISVYNFLKYSDPEWEKLNPSIMYQNRMRHSDYLKIIKDAGFEIQEDKPSYPDESELSCLKELKVDEYFKKNYSIEEMSIKSSIIVLRKNSKN